MKKISFKKAVASVAALSLAAAGMSAISASARAGVIQNSDARTGVVIDQVLVTLEEAQAGAIPVYVRLTNTYPDGFNGYEFGVEVADGCTVLATNSSGSAQNMGGEGIDAPATFRFSTIAGKENFTWITDASDYGFFTPDDFGYVADPLNIALLAVTITNPQPGDLYPITYQDTGVVAGEDGGAGEARTAKFSVGNTLITDQVEITDGWIRIEGEAPQTTTTTEETTTTTAPSTTTAAPSTTTAAPDTTTAAPDTTTAPATTTTTGATTPAATTTTTTGAGNTSTGSPQTGSTDVLPIAGAAAAVAVLGGVALVAKKKND